MKNFRSSKNLKAPDLSTKSQSNLRMKIKSLEQQVQMLQKSNLNIFIPLSEQDKQTMPNYDAIINKLKTQILTLQQQAQALKLRIKKLDSQKEMQKITFQNEICQLKQFIVVLEKERKELKQSVEVLEQELSTQQQKRKQKEKQVIELTVENRFLKEDIEMQKKRMDTVQKKYEELHSLVLAVHFNSKIYRSKELKITAIQTNQLKNLKNYIQDLQNKIKQLLSANKQETISLGVKKQNMGEQIVRLKKNIDLQLGLKVNESSTNSFLEAYNKANNKFDELLTACKIS